MNIINSHSGPLGLPNGQVLPVGGPTDVADWGAIKRNSCVAAWRDAGILSEADDKPAKGEKGGKAKADDKPAKG